uniref:Major facilitator superfamily (MFS) profile domain-containing protein n=1 Tax=Romanomermis culicivorax TaxID=13658 RepID=A0A915KTG2_ROMCU
MYVSMNLSTNELHPTAVRSIALSIVSTFSRTGSAVAPQLLYFATKLWSPAMYAIFCVITLIYLTLYLFFIPETRGRPMPHSMPTSRKSSSAKKSAHML